MKQKTIKKAVKSINRNIRKYQRKLTYQLELRAEATLGNGNLDVSSLSDCYEAKIERYEIILADLATIKRAISKEQLSVNVYGTAKNSNYMYNETLKAVKEAGFDVDFIHGMVQLLPVKEWEEEWEDEMLSVNDEDEELD